MKNLDVKSDKITVGVAAHSDPLKQKGITLIALIITIIVMLILVGVTVNVALNGGLFSKAEESTTKTKIAQIQEALTIKKAEVLADKNGKTPDDYEITLEKLSLPEQLRTEYKNKLIVSKDGILYYDESVVTNKEEQNIFKSMGIQPYIENPVQTRIPFTNYIENGNNYYINGDPESDSYQVVKFSKQQKNYVLYDISQGEISIMIEPAIEVIDKNQIETRLGYTKDMVENGLKLSFDEINDDVMIWSNDGQDALNIFKNNYEEVIVADKWYTLDRTYTFPSE